VAEVVAGRGPGETLARNGIAGVFPCEDWLRARGALIKKPMELIPRGAETAYLREEWHRPPFPPPGPRTGTRKDLPR